MAATERQGPATIFFGRNTLSSRVTFSAGGERMMTYTGMGQCLFRVWDLEMGEHQDWQAPSTYFYPLTT